MAARPPDEGVVAATRLGDGYSIASRRCSVSRKLRSLASALASIWRARSRDRPNSRPTSSSVRGRPSPEAEAQLEHEALARGEGVEQALDLRAPLGDAGRGQRLDRRLVFDQLAEKRVVALAARGLEAHRHAARADDLAHLVGGDAHLGGDLLGGGLAAAALLEAALRAEQLVLRFDDVHRQADGAPLVGEGPRDRLADPPVGQGRELEAAAVVELLDGRMSPRLPSWIRSSSGRPWPS